MKIDGEALPSQSVRLACLASSAAQDLPQEAFLAVRAHLHS